MVLGPLVVEGGWGIAELTRVETREPRPLDEIRELVLKVMKPIEDRNVLHRGLRRLEDAAEIEIQPGARETVAERVAAWGW